MSNSPAPLNLATEQCHLLYSVATQKSAIGDYPAAIKILSFLVKSAPSEQVKYMKALAGCLHYQESLQEAIHFYLKTYFTEPETNADCLLFATDCLLKLNHLQEAHDILAILLEAHQDSISDQLMAKSKMLQRIVSKKLR